MSANKDQELTNSQDSPQAEAKNNKVSNSDEIDLIEVIRYIWNGRWLILKVAGAFVALGLIIALTTTEQYESSARLLPEARETEGGASRLMQQFGVGDMLPAGGGADAIRPDLYPDVLKSTPFFLDLMEKDIEIETGGGYEEMTLFTYLDEHMTSFSLIGVVSKYTIRLPWTVLSWIRGSDPEEEARERVIREYERVSRLTKSQHSVIRSLDGRISASIDDRSGVISVSTEFPDPYVSAQVADYAVEYLTEYITEYRTEKAQQDLEFVKERYEEKKEEYHEAQLKLARFRDENRNIISAVVRTEEERLQNQHNMAYNIYNNIAQQLEQNRIKVQEKTPVIKELEPVHVPMERSKPRRSLIMVISLFLGGFVGVGAVFGKVIWGNIREQLRD